MSVTGELDLGLGLLDHQLVDSEGRRCGKVDDLELEGVGGGAPRVRAILTGPAAWRGRGALGRVAAALARGRGARLDWPDVGEIDSAVHLRRTASELGLGRGDDRAAPWLEKLPGSSL
jgi:hypothetical protein